MSQQQQQITIQLGSFSNYVGTHFWNYQDDILRDLIVEGGEEGEGEGEEDLIRKDNKEEKGIKRKEQIINYNLERLYQIRNNNNNRKISIKPRVLIIEQRGLLGTLNSNELIEEELNTINTWNGDKSVIRKLKEEKNTFLKMLEQEQNYFWDGIQNFEEKQQLENEEGEEYDEENEQEEDDDDDDDDNDDDYRVLESDVKYWSDFLKVRLNHSTICELPFWPISQPFDTYMSGASNDIISSDHKEEYFDHVRRLVEECDWLRNITVFADLYDGFGGLTCTLCQEIRDEIPRITMPIWCFTDDSSNSIPLNRLQKCNIPIAYSSLVSSEVASVIIPMSTFSVSNLSPFLNFENDLKYHTSAIFASVIEVATGFNRVTSNFSNHSSATSIDFNVPETKVTDDKITDANWISELTNNYQYRINTIEACLPFPLDPSKNQNNHDEFLPLWNVINSERIYDQTLLNPFMSSLSSAVWGDYNGSIKNHRVKRSLSNIINCRGFQSSDFVNQLQHRIMSSNHLYNVSSIHQRTYGLPIPISFPRIFYGVDKTGFVSYSPLNNISNISSVLFPSKNQSFTGIERNREINSRASCDSIVGMTGMGFDSNIITPHLEKVLSVWRERGGVNSSILVRLGLSADDCREIDENLATLVTNYANE